MSDTSPKSSPLAAASIMTPSKPSSIWVVSHPAIAIYLSPSLASEALNLVVAPISLAFSSNLFKSSPVAPLMACTWLIPASKSEPTFTATVPNPTKGAVIFMLRLLPTLSILLPICCIDWPKGSRLLLSLYQPED